MMNDVFATLREELSQDEPHRRYLAIIAIGDCEKMLGIRPDNELLGLIVPFLHDLDQHVKYYSAEAIGKLGLVEGRMYLVEAQKKYENVKFSAGPNPLEGIKKALNELDNSRPN